MASLTVKGDLRLEVDALGLEAILEFRPDPQGGADWNVESVGKILADARLSGVSSKTVSQAVQKFMPAKEPVRIAVAAGQAPARGQPEEADWAELETPPEMLPFKDACLVEAPPPALFKLRVERISRERVVKKPGLLPFLPGKEEKIVEVEKVERKEPVQVDRQVIKAFWAPAGALVARLIAPRPGRPGKDVYGKPLPAPAEDDPAFFLGDGLERGKGEITAKAAGWVRAGARWADLIPFAAHAWELRKSDDGATLLLDFTPGDRRLPPPSPQDVLAKAAEIGVELECMVDADGLSAALQRAARSGQALQGFSLSCDRDAEIRVEISPDRLKASLTLVKGRGNGKPLSLAELGPAIAAAKLKGIKADKLKADVLAFYKGPELELRDYPLCEGKEPVRGKDRSLSFTPAFLPDEQAKAYLDRIAADPALSRLARSLDEFPLSAANKLALVKKDQELARLSPPSFGQAGADVRGDPLPAAPGSDPKVASFENVRVVKESLESEEDGLALVEEKDGAFRVRVLPYRDARIEVRVSDDGMSAYLSLEKEYGLGRDLGLEAVQEALKAAGVHFGIDMKALSAALAEARAGTPVADRPVAFGKEPIPSGGWRINWITRLASGAAVTVRADGSADFKNQDRATIVAEGQPILELLAIGREGQEGTDVLGKPIKPPKDPQATDPPEWDDSVRAETTAEGNKRLAAARSGELKFEKNRLSVDPAWKINGDVGPATGNVRFPGPVATSGSVLTGYALVAGGDAFVAGAVEAALVSADGSVKIGEGVKGARKGTVRARKTIEASFAEQAQLMAVGDIVLKSSALLCLIKTNGKLVLQGDKGNLVGGQCRARMGVELQNLGAENNSKTAVSFGQDYLLKDAAEAEEREIERVKVQILKADKTMRDYERDGRDPTPVRQEKLKLVKLLEKRTMRLFQLNEKFEEHHPAEIVVRGAVYPGVVLESHNHFLEIRAKKQQVAFSFDVQLGRIVERPLK